MPDNLLSELCLISYSLSMYTATTIPMLLLLHTPFLPLSITNIISCKAGSTTQQTVNDLITGMVTSNIFCTSVRAGATAMVTAYNVSSNKLSSFGG
jgi:hypothetical protein